MGITCNISVYLPVDQKQCTLREDKYIETLSFFLHLPRLPWRNYFW